MRYLDRYIDVLYSCSRGWRTAQEINHFHGYRSPGRAKSLLNYMASRGLLESRKREKETEYRIRDGALKWRGDEA